LPAATCNGIRKLPGQSPFQYNLKIDNPFFRRPLKKREDFYRNCWAGNKQENSAKEIKIAHNIGLASCLLQCVFITALSLDEGRSAFLFAALSRGFGIASFVSKQKKVELPKSHSSVIIA
jgi:hypothetical protein